MIYDIKTEAELNTLLKEGGLVLLDFYAEWCGPCKMLNPILASLQKKFPKVKIAKIDIDELLTIASHYEVEVVPTVILIKDEKVVAKNVGSQSEAYFEELISQNI